MRPRVDHVTVRVLGGDRRAGGALFDGKPVLEYIQEHAEDAEKTEPAAEPRASTGGRTGPAVFFRSPPRARNTRPVGGYCWARTVNG
jgi:hypothetical protein